MLAQKAVSDMLFASQHQKRESRRNKGPGMGVPAQKYGLESSTAYLGMLLWMAERDKADEMKKITDLEKDISTYELWIKDAKKIKDSKETSYRNIEVSKPQVAAMKTVLRMKGLPTSENQSDFITLL